mmetsp:Transcript_14897/g.27547  ORF Transcript_14897/g.27547 Transcript_14897/m.27547 type:complete len:318 (+) Transcript_14897:49-1002(+)
MFGGSPKCPRCEKAVYFNERLRALENDWHRSCFKCTNCEKGLELGKQSEHNLQPYCKTCYSRLYGAKGYGYGVGATTFAETGLTKDGKPKDYLINKGAVKPAKRESKAPTVRQNSMVVTGAGNTCKVCDKTVGFAEKVSAMGATFHKDCFCCTSCSKKLNTAEFNNNKGNPYCKLCYNQNFGPKGFGFGGALAARNFVSAARAAPAAVSKRVSKRLSRRSEPEKPAAAPVEESESDNESEAPAQTKQVTSKSDNEEDDDVKIANEIDDEEGGEGKGDRSITSSNDTDDGSVGQRVGRVLQALSESSDGYSDSDSDSF